MLMKHILHLLFLPCLIVGMVAAGTHRALAQKKDQPWNSDAADTSS